MVRTVETREELDIITRKAENHTSFVTNRIWGGIQASGLFEMNFLLETREIPEKVTIEIRDDGTEKEIFRSNPNVVIRENQATAYMNMDTFINLYTWMSQKAKELEEMGLIEKASEV